jgi:hypothetical protein
MPNTLIRYQYRDAANYKATSSVVFAGRPTDDELARLLANRDEGERFIPSQVGLQDLQLSFNGRLQDDDHVWHELQAEDVEATDEPPTDPRDIHQFAAEFTSAEWDVSAAMLDIGIKED